MPMPNILIPYNSIGAKWQELKYCLRSIEKYISDAVISIYSDADIDWLQNVEIIKIDRFYPHDTEPKKFENYWDTLNKLSQYSLTHTEKFLYVYDDQVFLKEFDPEIFNNVALQKIEPGDAEQRKDRHGRTINKAIELLDPVGVDVYSYETHLPRLFDPRRVRILMNTFNILQQDTPPAFSTLYYNYFYDEPNQILTEKNDLRVSFCFEEDGSGCEIACNKAEIADACRDKYLLHYNDVGLRFSPWGHAILQEHIMELFPNKCKYEI
jgi:hypothetical protein